MTYYDAGWCSSNVGVAMITISTDHYSRVKQNSSWRLLGTMTFRIAQPPPTASLSTQRACSDCSRVQHVSRVGTVAARPGAGCNTPLEAGPVTEENQHWALHQLGVNCRYSSPLALFQLTVCRHVVQHCQADSRTGATIGNHTLVSIHPAVHLNQRERPQTRKECLKLEMLP